MSKPQITVAVTGLNAVDSPGPGLSVLRGIRESEHFDARIIGLAYESMEPGIYMHELVDKTYLIPYPSTGHETLLERLQYIHTQEKLDVLIPNFDAELFSFIKLGPKLKEMGVATFLPTMEQFEARHKSNLPVYGLAHDVLVPRSEIAFNMEEFEAVLKQFSYPVVVKGKFYEAYIAHSIEQARSYYYKLSAKWGTPIVLQQFVKGEEVNVTALGDGNGNLMGAVPMKKTYITSTGKGWAGVAIEDQQLMDIAERIMKGTHWRGGMELEMIRDEDGKVYLIEINPRFPAWVYLAVGAGQNHPEALVRMALGEEVEPFETYQTGTMFIRYSYDMICNLKEFEQISIYGEL